MRSSSREIVRAVVSSWLDGALPDPSVALSTYPALRDDLSALLELAYEAFCIRRQSGEQLDCETYAALFPEISETLKYLIRLDGTIGHRPSIFDQPAEPYLAWPLPGDSVGGCLLLRELGRGAFARVYLGLEHSTGNRPVALKFSRADDHEAKTLGRLPHDHVVPIYWSERDPQSDSLLVCMPFLGSATLADVQVRLHPSTPARPPQRSESILEAIQTCAQPGDPNPDTLLRGPNLAGLSFVDGVARLAASLADALVYLHGRKQYHCDLKPSNILLTPLARPLLLDFNLARAEGKPSGRIGGTFTYMAPEQIRAFLDRKVISPDQLARIDLFSFGVILYELLGGVHPFGEVPENLPADAVGAWMLDRIPRGIVPLERLNPQVPRPLADLVERCLAVDPNQRPTSAAEVARCLHPRRTKSRQFTITLTGMTAAILVGMSFLALGASRDRPEPPAMEQILSNRAEGLSALARGCRLIQNHQPESAQKELLIATKHLGQVLDLQTTLSQPVTDAWRDHFAQGRTLLLLGEVAHAHSYLSRANELWRKEATVLAGLGGMAALGAAPADLALARGPLLATLSWGYSLQGHHQEALFFGEMALANGYRSPGLLNNLGLNMQKLKQWDKAILYLDEAIQRAPHLHQALYNRCQVVLRQQQRGKRTKEHSPIPSSVLRDIDTVLSCQQQKPRESADLYFLGTHLHAIGCYDARQQGDTKKEAHCLERARACALRACALGFDVKILTADPQLTSILGDAWMKANLVARATRASPSFSSLVDPLTESFR